MKISLNWIKEYISIPESEQLDSLQNKMISAGLDIESIVNESESLNKFIVGEITEKNKHPDADKLSLCKVNTGDGIIDIVCGAPNAEAGQKVCVALIGAIIPNGNFEIKKSKIRGKLSEGMICSEKELNLSGNHDGILVLDKEAVIGSKFSDYIKSNDVLFDIGITANRGDLFSHIGIAREIGAIYNEKIKLPEIKIKQTGKPTSEMVKISIEANDVCKRFTGRIVSGIKVSESPEWLKKRLISVGLKPKNNIVDITNFVMYETGQPLHAFDFDKIRGKEIKEIIVKKAMSGDKFTTLDSKERLLGAESLMICDGEGFSGLAGIMGGKNSEISENTKNIFLESAYFDPVSIRKNSKLLGLQTDASQRFERGVDIDMVKYASERATQLIEELAGGEISFELIDIYPEKFQILEIPIRLSKANDLLGTDIKEEEIKLLLGKIGIDYKNIKEGKLIFEVPQYRRHDVTREIDLTEEAARIYGYDNIEGEMKFNINVTNAERYNSRIFSLNKEITGYFTARGFNQILTNPLSEEKILRKYNENIVTLKNSISVEMDSMRNEMIFGMLKTIGYNFNNSGKDSSLKFFESGRIFKRTDKKFMEEDCLIIALSGKKDTEEIHDKGKDFDFFDIKGEAEMFLYKLNLENFSLIYYNDNVSNAIRADIKLKDEIIGKIYKADTAITHEFGIEKEVYAAEFNLNIISSRIGKEKKYSEISKYPSVKRDLALIADTKIKYEEIKNLIEKSSGSMLKNLNLFDIYADEKIGNARKSIAVRLEFSSQEKTLTDEETGKLVNKILNNLEKNLGVTLRT